jgi:RNA polymerase sigma factor (sigma-70 family)
MRHQRRVNEFQKVHARHKPFLETTLWKLTGNREMFADALQDALLAIWKHLEKLTGQGAKSYLYRIALSAAAKTWKNKPRTGNEPFNIATEDDDPANAVLDKESLQQLRAAITQLPNKQGQAIVMRYLQQKSYDDVASELNCTSATARAHVHKALQKLKIKLNHLVTEELSHE